MESGYFGIQLQYVLVTEFFFWNVLLFNNKTCYTELRTIFLYEHTSKNKFTGNSRKSLFEEIDPRDFYFTPKEGKIIINDSEDFLNQNRNMSFDEKKNYFIENILPERCSRMRDMFEDMRLFIHTEPRLPDRNKEYVKTPRLQITTEQTREEIIEHIASKASVNEFAELARYAYREMEGISWIPFTKAAIERNPVCIEGLTGKTIDETYQILMDMPGKSIYSGNRLAQPDEVWNFGLGDGIEKAFVLMNYMNSIDHNLPIRFEANGLKVIVAQDNGKAYHFFSNRRIRKKMFIMGNNIEEIICNE